MNGGDGLIRNQTKGPSTYGWDDDVVTSSSWLYNTKSNISLSMLISILHSFQKVAYKTFVLTSYWDYSQFHFSFPSNVEERIIRI